MRKIGTIILIILFFICFCIFYTISKASHSVLQILDAAHIIVDLNDNGHVDHDETVCIKDVEVLTSNFYTDNKELSEKLNISPVDSIKFGYFSDMFADNMLSDKKVKLKFQKSEKIKQSCKFADIITENGSYRESLISSGYGFAGGNPPKKFDELLEKAQKQNLVILNHKSNKYHELDCEYGKAANDAVIILKRQMPKDAKPCKFCHLEKEKHISHKSTNKTYPNIISKGDIKLFLTDLTVKLKPDRNCNSPACREVLSQINNTKSSIDMAVYGWDNIQAIYNALKSAKQRGVIIRIVYDNSKNSYSPETQNLLALADKKSGDGLKSLMHNKFMIFDNKTVATGSMNFSSTGFSGFNTNAFVIINSEDIAKIYTQEFEQMLSGRFSQNKSSVSHKTVNLNESVVTPYFLPTDKAITKNIIPLINNANSSIYMPAFVLTHTALANSLISAKKRGVDVKIIVDATGVYSTGSKIDILKASGIPVKVENYAGKVHSKSIIIDKTYLVIGSMNFSNSGENKNDENVLIIEDKKLGNFYGGFFEYLWNKIPDKYLTSVPKAESKSSVGSCSDGIDNDYDGKIDMQDEMCR